MWGEWKLLIRMILQSEDTTNDIANSLVVLVFYEMIYSV